MAQRRLNREEKKAETRSRLLAAAAQLFALKGFGGASIEEIAELAGYSRGAFYSNFSNKEELLRELFELDLEAQREARPRWAGKPSADAQLREGARWLMERNQVELVLLLEFILHGVRDEEFTGAVAGYWREVRSALADQIVRQAGEEGRELVTPAESLASVVIGMGVGFVLQHLVDPEQVPAEALPAMLSLVMTGEPAADWRPGD